MPRKKNQQGKDKQKKLNKREKRIVGKAAQTLRRSRRNGGKPGS
jgi:hypothetical protein